MAVEEIDDRTEEDFEAAAREEGWVPEDEYRGRGTWVDARTFVLRGENVRPLLRSRNRRLEAEIVDLKVQLETAVRTMGEQKSAIEAATNLARRANEQGYQRALRDAEARRDGAIENGDVTVARQVQAEIDTLRDERDPPTAAPSPPEPTPAPSVQGMDPQVQLFINENPWFNTDSQLRDAMIAHHRVIIAETPNMPLDDQLALAKSRVRKRFPEKFESMRAAAAEPDEDDAEFDDDPPPREPREPRMTPNTGARRPAPERGKATDPFMEITDITDRAMARVAFRSIETSGDKLTAREYVDLYFDPKAPVNVIRKREK